MNEKNSRRASVIGTLLFFITIGVIVSSAIVIYDAVEDACDGNRAVIAGVILAVIIVLSAVCTIIDVIRRRLTIDKPVQRILEATNKIAAGDFSARLEITHRVSRYDEFDYIMENLNKMAAELSRTEVLHTDFISNVSHEIKTPLAVIQNYAASLQNKNLDEATRNKYAQTLESAAKRLTALITNILKLNKLENQEIKPGNELINLTEALAETVLGYEDLIESKGLELDCDFDDDVKIYSSPAYLEIVWNNLLSNAVKFTDSGKISISLKNENGHAVVKITDTGCGITAETGKHIFEKFYQGDTSHSQEGNGLGLALVKKVIDINGGTIDVNSEAGKGTTFTIRLKTGVRQ
ncbi:MAG: HAMP domain-containing histidine kinase [Clostridia bacterium]|nr:HAMP domain-containing histidine kinase [Clostridia bacterium]